VRLLPLIAALSCALPACASQAFVDLDFAAATARAKAEDKLLLVDITSANSPLAQKMDAQTWPDGAVTSWIREHAVAIRVDADAQPELAQSLGFTRPTSRTTPTGPNGSCCASLSTRRPGSSPGTTLTETPMAACSTGIRWSASTA
jgi:Protein of unknown function, DUF255